MINYWLVHLGGLGLHHVHLKSQAILIRSFLETAAHPAYLHSLLHTSLFRYHILEHRDLEDPGNHPFYSRDFFNTIKYFYKKVPRDIATLTSAECSLRTSSWWWTATWSTSHAELSWKLLPTTGTTPGDSLGYQDLLLRWKPFSGNSYTKYCLHRTGYSGWRNLKVPWDTASYVRMKSWRVWSMLWSLASSTKM